MAEANAVASSMQSFDSVIQHMGPQLMKSDFSSKNQVPSRDANSMADLRSEMKTINIRLNLLESKVGDVKDAGHEIYKQLLQKMDLAEFIEKFRDEGWTDPSDWKDMSDLDLSQMGMKKGHINRFRRKIQENMAPGASQTHDLSVLCKEISHLRSSLSNLQFAFNSNVDAMSDMFGDRFIEAPGETSEIVKLIRTPPEGTRASDDCSVPGFRMITVVSDKSRVKAATPNWVPISGTERRFHCDRPSYIEVIAHAHGKAENGSRVDFAPFHNGQICILGENFKGWASVGMALSHCSNWVPLVAVGTAKIDPGDHIVDLRVMCSCKDAGAHACASGYVLKIFPC